MADIDKIIESFFRHYAGIVIYIAPGVFVLDLVFKRGFFSNTIMSWIDLIFILFWGIVLSLPFHYYNPKGFLDYLRSCLRRYLNKNSNIGDEELLEQRSNEVEIEFVLIKVITFYFIFKLLTWQTLICFSDFFGISSTIIIFFLSMVFTILVSHIAFFGYEKVFRKKSG